MTTNSALTMITVDAFLEALNLPTEHPYIHDASASDFHSDAPKKWSITNYFLSWKDSPSTSPAAQVSSSNSDYCVSDFPMPSWVAKFTGNKVCRDADQHAIAAGSNSTSTSTDVGFLEEISPCLVSMLHMNILLWAPIVLLICLRRLTKPLPSNQRRKTYAGRRRLADGEFDNKQTTPSSKKIPRTTSKSALLVMNYLPIMTNNTKANQTTYKAPQTTLNFFTFPTNVLSRADSKDEAAMSSPTGGYFTYIVALFFSAFIMIDPMYVYEFSQATLVIVHLLIISLGMKRLGAKVALYTSLPVSAIAFYVMAHQDLNLPTFSPGLYFDESNSLVTTVVSKWPIDKRTYDDGRGTPWMMTGDTRTGLPFMFYKIPVINFQRR